MTSLRLTVSTKRFQNVNPGPGTYGEGGIPAASQEKRQTQSASTVGMLDAGKIL